MEESAAVRDGWLRFVDGLTKGDLDRFDDIVSTDAHLIIGTAPGEHISTREQMKFGFATEGITLESHGAKGWSEGDIGWVFDEARFGFPDGNGMQTRITAVMRKEGDVWRVLHAHFSVGVPDEEVVELQKRWGTN